MESVNEGAKTPSVRVVDAVRLPDVPVMVKVVLPILAELTAAKVRIELNVVGFVENDAVTPLGSPVTERLTLPLKPYTGLT